MDADLIGGGEGLPALRIVRINGDEIQQMKRLVREAMGAGAAGFMRR